MKVKDKTDNTKKRQRGKTHKPKSTTPPRTHQITEHIKFNTTKTTQTTQNTQTINHTRVTHYFGDLFHLMETKTFLCYDGKVIAGGIPPSILSVTLTIEL